VGVEGIQQEARTYKDKLDGHHEMQPEEHDKIRLEVIKEKKTAFIWSCSMH